MSKTALSTEQSRELAALADQPDHEIDTDDIPEAPAENWRCARRGARPRLVSQPETGEACDEKEFLKPFF